MTNECVWRLKQSVLLKQITQFLRFKQWVRLMQITPNWKRQFYLETVAGEALSMLWGSKTTLQLGAIGIRSPFASVSVLLSSNTLLRFSIQMASTGPSKTIQMCSPWQEWKAILEGSVENCSRQPHLCFCLHARVWLLYFIRSMSKRRKSQMHCKTTKSN